jgi:hypothetical protein
MVLPLAGSAKHHQHHLRHYHGVLQADAFAGYVRLFSAEREGGPLTEATRAEKSTTSI